MSNLQSAKSAIKAEIIHAKQGLAFYESRLDILEKTLDQLDSVNLPEAKSKVERKASKKASSSTKKNPARKTKPASAGTKALPVTGGDYWLNLISTHPQSGAEIFRKAVDQLGFEPTKMQIKTLRQRVAPALKSLLQAQKIKDTGAGRERRYVKA